VRASEDWHQTAIATAYAGGDQEWMLTAVESVDPEIHFEADEAADHWELGAAWPHIAALVNDARTPKHLLIAAVGAAGSIRPKEAAPILVELADSDDEEEAKGWVN